jgi:hypothetical protein
VGVPPIAECPSCPLDQWTGLLPFLIICALCFSAPCGPIFAQVVGDEAELERLRNKAEDAMANDDAEGAAMSIGRAALLAVHLAKRDADPDRGHLFRGAEHLFRSQEHGYRALALFRRAGGQLPASTGVCGSLSLAQAEVQQSVQKFDEPFPSGHAATRTIQYASGLRQAAENWIIALAAIQSDFQCT